MKGNDRIFVALDGMTIEGVMELMERIGKDQVAGVKANDLLDACLNSEEYSLRKLIRELKRYAPLFWADQKLSDVGNTVFNRVSKYEDSGVDLITVMAGEGAPMIRKAIEAAGDKIGIIGVTVLTDKKEEDAYLNLGGPTKAMVLQYAMNIVLAGGKRVVCSGQELSFLRQYPEFNILERYVPAIRPEWAPPKGQDKSRITTPLMALRGGAHYLVIGSPIYDPPKKIGTPSDAVHRILEEVARFELESPETNG